LYAGGAITMAKEVMVNKDVYRYKYWKSGGKYDILLSEPETPFAWNVIGKVYEFQRASGGAIWWAEGRKGKLKISNPGQTRKAAVESFIKDWILAPSAEND
jgi:hypothetical protein